MLQQFDTVITGLEAGQPVDLSAMPPSPCTLPPHRPIIEASVQQSAEPEPAQLAELQGLLLNYSTHIKKMFLPILICINHLQFTHNFVSGKLF